MAFLGFVACRDPASIYMVTCFYQISTLHLQYHHPLTKCYLRSIAGQMEICPSSTKTIRIQNYNFNCLPISHGPKIRPTGFNSVQKKGQWSRALALCTWTSDCPLLLLKHAKLWDFSVLICPHKKKGSIFKIFQGKYWMSPQVSTLSALMETGLFRALQGITLQCSGLTVSITTCNTVISSCDEGAVMWMSWVGSRRSVMWYSLILSYGCFHLFPKFPKLEIPPNGCLIRTKSSTNGWFGGTPISGNLHIII